MASTVIIREEERSDYRDIEDVIRKAFEPLDTSDNTEYILVRKLRSSRAYIKELSLVATLDKDIVGHVMLSRVEIINNTQSYPALALAPVSVLPKYQNRGLGAAMIRYAHRKAQEMGFRAVIVIGHAGYYKKFGYRPASGFNIISPFTVPDKNFMVVSLYEDGHVECNGIVKYGDAFYN